MGISRTFYLSLFVHTFWVCSIPLNGYGNFHEILFLFLRKEIRLPWIWIRDVKVSFQQIR